MANFVRRLKNWVAEGVASEVNDFTQDHFTKNDNVEKNRFCFENTASTFIILNNIDIVDFGKDLNANIVFFWQN